MKRKVLHKHESSINTSTELIVMYSSSIYTSTVGAVTVSSGVSECSPVSFLEGSIQ